MHEVRKIWWVILVLVCLSAPTAGKTNMDVLLHPTNKTVMDTIWLWYRAEVRPLDSAQAIPILNDLLQKATDEKHEVAVAAANFHLGEYYAAQLHDTKKGIAHMKKGLQIAEEYGTAYQQVHYMHYLGMAYFNFAHQDNLALEYLLRAHERMLQLDKKKNIHGNYYVYELSYVYYKLGNYDESLKYLLMTHDYPIETPWQEQLILNNTGLAYKQLGKPDSAFYYYNKTLALSRKNNDTVWMGIASGNLGELYLERRDYENARVHFQRNYDFSLKGKKKEFATAINALTALAEIDLVKGNADSALDKTKQAEGMFSLLRKDADHYFRYGYLYEVMSKVYAAKKNMAQAYIYLKRSYEVKDSVARRNKDLDHTKIKEQLNIEKQEAGLKLIAAQNKSQVMARNFLLLAMTLIIFIGVLIGNYQRLKARNEKEILTQKEELLRTEKKMAETELQQARRILEYYVQSVYEKNELIEQFKKRLEEMEAKYGDIVRAEHSEELDQLHHATILTEDAWQDFKLLFEKAHAGFFTRLRQIYPNLTEAETRLLCLTKLNIPTKDMAGMLGISPESIRKAKYRLRKKLELPEEGDLDDVVAHV
jgi:tetratricopeptide (TPR) repeat protein